MDNRNEVFKKVLTDLGFHDYKPSQMSNSDYWLCTNTAMQSYSDLQNASLLTRVKELEAIHEKPSQCPRCQHGHNEDIVSKPITHDCLSCGATWQSVYKPNKNNI